MKTKHKSNSNNCLHVLKKQRAKFNEDMQLKQQEINLQQKNLKQELDVLNEQKRQVEQQQKELKELDDIK